MTNSDFHIYHEEGNWRAVRFRYSGGEHDYVEHRCLVRGNDIPEWVGFRYTYSAFNLPCPKCAETVPVNVQTTYVLITGDMDTMAETWLYAKKRIVL